MPNSCSENVNLNSEFLLAFKLFNIFFAFHFRFRHQASRLILRYAQQIILSQCKVLLKLCITGCIIFYGRLDTKVTTASLTAQ